LHANHIGSSRYISPKIIFGAADQWVDPAATVQWKAESRAEIELFPGIGHTPVAECPELLALRIHQFIKN
jgi:pimeloyl-ACP methyl ester carboxylesterase